MSKLFLVIVAAALVVSAPPTVHASTFTFTGQCNIVFTGNCIGTGNGTLVLQNYAEGNPIGNGNFVSFTYKSTVFSFSFSGIGAGTISNGIGTGGISSISGTLQDLPGSANVQMDITAGLFFLSDVGGFWCAGINCNDDTGTASSWSATPLPAALPLFATGLGGLGLLGWRKKRKAQVA
jgi:hypothetical protein